MSLNVPTADEVLRVLDNYLPTYTLEQESGIVVNDWYLDDEGLILEAERNGTIFQITITATVDPR